MMLRIYKIHKSIGSNHQGSSMMVKDFYTYVKDSCDGKAIVVMESLSPCMDVYANY